MSALPVEAHLPARRPWVLVDAVASLDDDAIRCRKEVSASDFFLIGHFPARGVYPGIVLAAAMAQAAEVLVRARGLAEGAALRLAEVDVHLLSPVVPGDSLEVEVRRAAGLRFTGVVWRRGAVVVRGTFALVPDAAVREGAEIPTAARPGGAER